MTKNIENSAVAERWLSVGNMQLACSMKKKIRSWVEPDGRTRGENEEKIVEKTGGKKCGKHKIIMLLDVGRHFEFKFVIKTREK